MKKYFLPLLFSLSTNSHAWDGPETAVSELVKFDLNGGRLTFENWAVYTTNYLTALPVGYEEPGWDEVTIVKSFRVSNQKCTENLCKVDVEFELYPTSNMEPGQFIAHPNGGTEKIVYVAVKEGPSWKVQAAKTAAELVGPHISIATYKNL